MPEYKNEKKIIWTSIFFFFFFMRLFSQSPSCNRNHSCFYSCNFFLRKSSYYNSYIWSKNITLTVYSLVFTFFLRNTFSKEGPMFLKISSIWAWNVSSTFLINFGPYKSPSSKNGYLQCAQLCLLFFFLKFQVNWTYFPVEMASTLWVWFSLFVLT